MIYPALLGPFKFMPNCSVGASECETKFSKEIWYGLRENAWFPWQHGTFSNSLWVAIETMQFHIAQTKIFLRTPSFPIQGVPMNNLAPMKNCPGGGGGAR